MKILSFDIESCNGNPRQASLCSFGYCIFDEKFNILEKDDILVNPVPKKFTIGNFGNTKGIKLSYPESVFRNSPLFCEVYDKICSIFSKCDFAIGFSIINDLHFLNCACKHYNLNNVIFSYLDVQQLYALYCNNPEVTSLEKAVEGLKVDFIPHKSDDDALAVVYLLKSICQGKGLTLEDLIDYYGLVMGNNALDGFTNSYSMVKECQQKGFKRSSKLNKFLFVSYLTKQKKQKGFLTGKRFNFSKKLAYSDINLSRSLIACIYSKGGVYNTSLNLANCIVVGDDEEINQEVLSKTIKLSELLSMLDDFKELMFDDRGDIIKFYRKNRIKN